MTTTTTTLLETCQVQPPASSAAAATTLSLPLSFLDLIWLHFHPIRHLLFYNHPCSKPHFLETLVPNLKQSLSLTLQHYLPLSGNLLYPVNNDEQKPIFRYAAGDSVPVTIAVSGDDFDDLVANHARDADRFYDFIPEMPPIRDGPEYKMVPVLAIRVTLFPDRGVCIGFSNHHAVGDASSIFRFMETWSSIAKLGEAEPAGLSLPVFDRSFVRDPLGIDSIYWKVARTMPSNPSSFPLPTNRVRSTFILRQADIKRLKDLALARNPALSHVSSFVVTVSYIWTCLVKSSHKSGEKVDADTPEMFIYMVDIRGRIDPPVPENYFGNCLAYGLARLEHEKVVGVEGFAIAAAAIAEDIKNRVNNKEEVLKGAENWMSGWEDFAGKRIVGVSGSPRFDFCDVDFGWGRARKLEVLSMDGESYSMSLCKGRDGDGGLEIGLSLPRKMMEAFAGFFAEGLKLKPLKS